MKAPIERVYKTWTEPKHIQQWFGCGQLSEIKVQQDFKVGGEYRVEANHSNGKISIMQGTYKEIVANKKLVYTWTNNSEEYPADNTLVTVEFISKGKDETELILKHEYFEKPISAQGHTMGWSAALEKFEALLNSAE